MAKKNKREINNYIIIPSIIKTSNIPAGAKLLYGDILSMSKNTGFCYASNDYFKKEYLVHRNSIINWIRCLKKNNFISVLYEKDMKGKIQRKIYPKIKIKQVNYDTTRNKFKTKVVI